MNQKVVLITGANKGLGLEIARQLGRRGLTVVVAARSADKADAAAETLRGEGLDAHGLKLDVTSEEDIAALPGYFEKQFGRLDVLVNNAGILTKGPEAATPRSVREVIGTNAVAPYAIAYELLPLLKAAPAGRIVNQSSQLGSFSALTSGAVGADYIFAGYSASKAALNMLTVVLAKQLEDTGVKVNAVHPGWVRTEMGGPNAALDIETGAKTAVELATLPDDGPTGGFFHLGQRLPW